MDFPDIWIRLPLLKSIPFTFFFNYTFFNRCKITPTASQLSQMISVSLLQSFVLCSQQIRLDVHQYKSQQNMLQNSRNKEKHRKENGRNSWPQRSWGRVTRVRSHKPLLTPCSDSSSSVLTLTAGIPSSINILFSKALMSYGKKGQG